MDFRDQVFLSVAENLSFSKAAKELFISQPAVTNHIKELESKLNITLFERKGSRIYLTQAGKVAYDHLKEIREKYQELEFNIGRLNEAFKGKLHIGSSSTISQYLIPKVIADFHKRYPEIKLYLLNGNSFEMEQKLLENDIDIALVENNLSHSDIRYIDFLNDEIIAVAGKNTLYAKRKNLSINEISEIPIILREKGSGTLEVIENSLGKHNISLEELNVVLHLGSTEAIKNFLINFDGVALISEKAIEKELRLNELVRINIKNANIKRQFRIALRHGQNSSTSDLMTNFLLNYNF